MSEGTVEETKRSSRLEFLSNFEFRISNFLPLAFLLWLPIASPLLAQTRPYIGFAYPAGGRQGTTFQVKLGGQGLENVTEALITGTGVSAKVIDYWRVLNPQEMTLLSEQLKELKRAGTNVVATTMGSESTMMMADDAMMSSDAKAEKQPGVSTRGDRSNLVARIEKRTSQYVNRPASVALANIVYIEVTIAPDAEPGPREVRLATTRGISNPLVFHVGQLPEFSRQAMVTAPFQVLGKESLSLRKRPADQVEDRVNVPCTINGQIASGEVNRHRFAARAGQRLVITTRARELIPYIADAVPGWFQPVLALYDADGREVAYEDDFRFKPDPTILYQVPKDGEYVLEVFDAIYRGREDFVYRITIGETPFVTSAFPLGSRTNTAATLKLKGWNLGTETLTMDASQPEAGIRPLVITNAGVLSNPLLFAVDALPEATEKESNNTLGKPQPVKLPVIINGRVDRTDDWDVFQLAGKSNQTVVAEVYARRLDSPLDSVLKLTDAKGKLLAFSDDCEDLASGVNTHHADSYLVFTLPADGLYYLHLGDASRHGSQEYGYRLRISGPQPDFALRTVPSSVSLRGKGTAILSVHVIRKDGFTGPIKLTLKDPPEGFSATPASLSGTQAVARLTVKTTLAETKEPVNLMIIGTATIQGSEVTRQAVPAEDRMQAFFWRHLVPATELKAMVYDPNSQPPPKRIARARAPTQPDTPPAVAAGTNTAANKLKFTKQQVAGRLRQLKLLFEEGLLTDDFYDERVAECEAVQ